MAKNNPVEAAPIVEVLANKDKEPASLTTLATATKVAAARLEKNTEVRNRLAEALAKERGGDLHLIVKAGHSGDEEERILLRLAFSELPSDHMIVLLEGLIVRLESQILEDWQAIKGMADTVSSIITQSATDADKEDEELPDVSK